MYILQSSLCWMDGKVCIFLSVRNSENLENLLPYIPFLSVKKPLIFKVNDLINEVTFSGIA